jgi:hypothetical protein
MVAKAGAEKLRDRFDVGTCSFKRHERMFAVLSDGRVVDFAALGGVS